MIVVEAIDDTKIRRFDRLADKYSTEIIDASQKSDTE